LPVKLCELGRENGLFVELVEVGEYNDRIDSEDIERAIDESVEDEVVVGSLVEIVALEAVISKIAVGGKDERISVEEVAPKYVL